MIVLGIDPGYALMGWGVVEANGSQMKLLGYGCIETKAGTPMQHRLRTLQLGVRDLTLMYRPDEVAFEELFFAQNVTTALMVGAARNSFHQIAPTCAVRLYPSLNSTPLGHHYNRTRKQSTAYLAKSVAT